MGKKLQLLWVALAFGTVAGGLADKGLADEARPASTIQRDAPVRSGLFIYRDWVVRAVDTGEANLSDPLYLELLSHPDGDLYFISGLSFRKQTIRRSSAEGLARLRTGRSLGVLLSHLQSKNMFTRERAMNALAKWKQPRCVDIMLGILKDDPDPQMRLGAASHLGELDKLFKDARIEPALLEALKDIDRVAAVAAYELGKLQSAEAVDLTYQLAQRTDKPFYLEQAIYGLVLNRRKRAVEYAIRLLPDLAKHPDGWADRLMRDVTKTNRMLETYVAMAKQALPELALTGEPKSAEDWAIWWREAAPLFDDNMKIRPVDQDRPFKRRFKK